MTPVTPEAEPPEAYHNGFVDGYQAGRESVRAASPDRPEPGLRAALRAWMAEPLDHVHPFTPTEERLMKAARAALRASPDRPGWWVPATAKGTAINVDEWDRPLHVYTTNEPHPVAAASPDRPEPPRLDERYAARYRAGYERFRADLSVLQQATKAPPEPPDLYWDACRDFDAPASCYTNDGTGLWCDPCRARRDFALQASPDRLAGGLDEAWTKAEAALPEGLHIGALKDAGTGDPATRWEAWAAQRGGTYWPGGYGYGPTPAAALLALADRLSESKP